MAPRREASFNCEIIGQLTTTDLTTCSREGVEDARSRLMKLNVPIRITISELAYTRALLEERPQQAATVCVYNCTRAGPKFQRRKNLCQLDLVPENQFGPLSMRR
jgi:hypothetical protein